MADWGKTEVRIDVDRVTRELQNMVSSYDNKNSLSKCSIFRVPNILRSRNPKAYEPNSFSIGPFHHKKPHLQDSQQIKVSYLKALLRRANPDHPVELQNLIKEVSKIKETARSCYAGLKGTSGEDFVKTLVLDGCFLIELFLRKDNQTYREQQDPIFSMSIQVQIVYNDLILLENQIPWIVLECLYEKTKMPDCTQRLDQLANVFFQDRFSFCPKIETDLPCEVQHILDLLRIWMAGSFLYLPQPFTNHWEKNMHSVSMLEEAGIKFRERREEAGINFRERRDLESPGILELWFDNYGGVLEIPQFMNNELTEPLLRNLISYEQCWPECKGIVTSYAMLLDNLIKTEEDVKILEKKGVVRNWLSTEGSTKLFNQLYDDTGVKDFYYTMIIKDVNAYCQRRCPRYRRVLMVDYFKNPWSIVSLIAAATLLILTVLQTVFTITK